MSTTLRSSKLVEICTPSIAYDAQVQSASEAFDSQMYEIIDDTGQVVMIPSIMGLTDETLVDILAWQFHVDFYDNTKPLAFRKQLVQLSITWHMTKGTYKLVKDVLNLYWPGGATIAEWYEYDNPFPPNYPTVSLDTLAKTFGPANVDVANNKFVGLSGHGLVTNDQIRFETHTLAIGSKLPTPLLPGIFYRVINPTASTLQVSPSIGGSAIDLLDVGVGNNDIFKRGLGDWHDRYRFRILIDEQVIKPEDQEAVLALIDRYKPVSRWCEGLFNMKVSECDIGWAGMTLQFIYKTSEAPDYP